MLLGLCEVGIGSAMAVDVGGSRGGCRCGVVRVLRCAVLGFREIM